MAGIEPASERIDPRTPTSVVCFWCHLVDQNKQNFYKISRSDPKVLFHTLRDVMYGTSTLWRPLCYRLKSGAGRRDAS